MEAPTFGSALRVSKPHPRGGSERRAFESREPQKEGVGLQLLPPPTVERLVPEQGSAVLFPGDVTHQGLPVYTGRRHLFVASFTLHERGGGIGTVATEWFPPWPESALAPKAAPTGEPVVVVKLKAEGGWSNSKDQRIRKRCCGLFIFVGALICVGLILYGGIFMFGIRSED